MFLTAPISDATHFVRLSIYQSEQWIWTWNRTWPYPLRRFFFWLSYSFFWQWRNSTISTTLRYLFHWSTWTSENCSQNTVRTSATRHAHNSQPGVVPDRFLGAEVPTLPTIETNFKASCFRDNNIELKKYFSVRSNIKPHAACIYVVVIKGQTWYCWKQGRKESMQRHKSHEPVMIFPNCFLTGSELSSDRCSCCDIQYATDVF